MVQATIYSPIPARDIRFMRLALVQAKMALHNNESPIGAITVLDNQVIGAGFNRKEIDHDPVAHAEIVALQQAANHIGNWRLTAVTLYCTLEPCPMCAGAMIQARLSRLVYGAKDIRFGASGSIVDLLQHEQFNHHVQVRGGVLVEESAELLQQFFQKQRLR